MRDRLFLLSPNFLDPAFPGQRFFCWHCALLEGVLASFPNLAESLDVERISWPRPRQSVIDLIGVENQSLPVLILADDAEAHLETDSANGRRFAEGKDAYGYSNSATAYPSRIHDAGIIKKRTGTT